ncbi:rhomboid family intramembrane serine protease [Natrinema halophilum]|uniref:Rhomboid family intramembrane serine protease n=1 Tax=Natrinema halophilum TaxID=1699371 RepID=A0A7D5L362_9EURY|nr:rhomboid family intramembrane serine protease [Natrinema halophilum]QLG47685.1 rhomboid family intramembrane serine protease [Natrinema halophilum]
MRLLAILLAVTVAATLVGSIAVVRRIHRPEPRWRDIAQQRLLYGVPWGTIVVIAFVLCVYLFVQSGFTDFDNPVTIPFRTWSYFYPLGMATAAFSHAGPGHLIGNLTGTVVAAPIAEYAWGHYLDDGDTNRADSWRTDPRVRAVVIFPLAVIVVGLMTSLFALGPVIGFSGVVFAFAGFAIVHYPIVTIIGTLGVQSVIVRLYSALQEPIRVYTVQPSPPSAPWWAGIAIQGHALGLFLGFVLGIVLLERRNTRPDPFRIWLAVLLFGFTEGLWAIYWYGAENSFILLQGPGVAIVSILALLVTLSVSLPEEPIVPARLKRLIPGFQRVRARSGAARSSVDRVLELAGSGNDADTAGARIDRIRELAAGPRRQASESPLGLSVSRRSAAFLAVVCVLAIVAGIAVPFNVFVVEDATASSDAAVQIEDYTVEYVEGVPNGLVTGFGLEFLETDDGLESSGVIVESDKREVWFEAVSAQRLAFTGEETVYVGGPGWREAVHVERTGWVPVGNDTVYQVWLWEDGAERQLAHESNDSRAEARIAGRNVTIDSSGGEFVITVDSGGIGDASSAPLPAENSSTTIDGVSFERRNETVYAAADGTRVAVAREETYDGY